LARSLPDLPAPSAVDALARETNEAAERAFRAGRP
jgi:hypothetical protein